MKTFILAVSAAIGGYITGLLGGMLAIDAWSANVHDRSVEAAMTGALVTGPILAVAAAVVVVVYRFGRSGTAPDQRKVV